MTATKVLSYLVENLREEGLIAYDKEFLNYVGISQEIVTPKQLHGFLDRNGNIQNKLFLTKIETHFEFPQSVWTGSEVRQKSLIKEAIKHELYIQSLPGKEALDISEIIPTNMPCTTMQLDILNTFSMITSRVESEIMIDDFLKKGLLERKVKNQAFLVELVKLAYDKGLYVIIVEFIIPNLYKKQHEQIEVQKYIAHTYGSLNQYDKAQQILSILLHHNEIENINLRTSALSNHKRALLQDLAKPIEADILYQLTSAYQELHAYKGIYSYYTGINLLYMTILGTILFSSDIRFTSININKIYTQSKPSLGEDKTHNDYYVSMSRFEFLLLLGREGILEKIESFLDNEEPDITLVERTLRQMELFVNNCKSTNHPLVKEYTKIIQIIQAYIRQFKE